MRVTVFTVMIGKTDMLASPLVVDPAARYLCFSDRPVRVTPYEWVRIPPSTEPRLASRRVKALADHSVLLESDATLYHDASYRLLCGPGWVSHLLEREPCDLVALRHPKRRVAEREAKQIAKYGYLPRVDALAHVRRYREAGCPKDVITAGGLLGRRVSPIMAQFNALWWDEVQRWNGRDQASLDFCAWSLGVRIYRTKGTIKDNVYAAWREAPELEEVSA